MHIESIHIKNFRNIQDRVFEFQKGLNVIIGTNNSGKTNLIKAVNLINNNSSVTVNDFNKNKLKNWQNLYFDQAPQIELVYTIKHRLNMENYEDDKVLRLLPFMEYSEFEATNPNYLIKAKIKMVYSLDIKSLDDYKAAVKLVKFKLNNKEYPENPNDIKFIEKQAFDDYTLVLKRLEHKFKWHFYNGITDKNVDEDIENINFVDMENQTYKSVKNILDIEYIEADRNSEKMSNITRRLVKKIIDKKEHSIDYCDIDRIITQEIKEKLSTALEEIDGLIAEEQDAIGIRNGNIKIMQDFDLASSTIIGEKHCFNVLDIKSDFNLPLDFNGLGYNNLISIFLIIKLPEVALDIFCIEEPEAHLHPAMQYKLFKYLKELHDKDDLNKQIFITTHSSNITAVTGLDNMIMLSYCRAENDHRVYSSQLKEQFTDEDENKQISKQNHKNHLIKFLDVTRSDMLFADKVILVEGISEKLMIPAFMKNEGFDSIDEHVSIVEIGGKHFEHFLSVFNCQKMTKKILCIRDNDFPFIDNEAKKCKKLNVYNRYTEMKIRKEKNVNKCILNKFQKNYGVTFEDSLFLDNFPLDLTLQEDKIEKETILIKLLKIALPETMHFFIDENILFFDNWFANINNSKIHYKTKERLRKLMSYYKNAMDEDIVNKNIYEKLFFAKLYLEYAQNAKGKVALDILVDEGLINSLVTPSYIKEGIEWLKQ